MRGRPQPSCIVERSGPDADEAIARQAVDPAGAIGANEAGVEPPTIGHPLERRGSPAVRRKAVSGNAIPNEKALLVIR